VSAALTPTRNPATWSHGRTGGDSGKLSILTVSAGLCDPELGPFSDFPDGNYQIPKLPPAAVIFASVPGGAVRLYGNSRGYTGIAVKLRGEK
jgi:hypothetical protein